MEVFFITGLLWMAFEDEGTRGKPGARKKDIIPATSGIWI
jgi:hypothetical protein